MPGREGIDTHSVKMASTGAVVISIFINTAWKIQGGKLWKFENMVCNENKLQRYHVLTWFTCWTKKDGGKSHLPWPLLQAAHSQIRCSALPLCRPGWPRATMSSVLQIELVRKVKVKVLIWSICESPPRATGLILLQIKWMEHLVYFEFHVHQDTCKRLTKANPSCENIEEQILLLFVDMQCWSSPSKYQWELCKVAGGQRRQINWTDIVYDFSSV